MQIFRFTFLLFLILAESPVSVYAQIAPENIRFVRQGVRRLIFDPSQSIPLAALKPAEIVGISAMYPMEHSTVKQARIQTKDNQQLVQSEEETQTGIWFGGFNLFATYTLDLAACNEKGELGFEFSDANKAHQFVMTVGFADGRLSSARLRIYKDKIVVTDEPIVTNLGGMEKAEGRLILQMLGSGLVLFQQNTGLPTPTTPASKDLTGPTGRSICIMDLSKVSKRM